MKTKPALLIYAALILGLFALGFAGVISLGGEAEQEAEQGRDRLIGVLISYEHLDLFDFDSYFSDNAEDILSGGELSPEDTAKYGGRLYASRPETGTEDGERQPGHVFDGVEGCWFFMANYEDEAGEYSSSESSGELSDASVHVSYTDEGEGLKIEGTIYTLAEGGRDLFFINPIYQSPSGEVYAISGNGTSMGGDIGPGTSHSTNLKEEWSLKDSSGNSQGWSCEIDISIEYVAEPVKVRILEYSGENTLVSASEYSPDELPESLSPGEDTEYIVLESFSRNAGEEQCRRSLYQREDEYLFCFTAREDGIVLKKSAAINWP